MNPTALRIHPKDSVAVLLAPLQKGTGTSGLMPEITLLQDIPAGHKVALRPIGEGEVVFKYGNPIGLATGPISAGEHVHTHNLRTGLSGQLCYAYAPDVPALPTLPPAFFEGYVRADSRVGVRNDIWILPTVGCVNGIAQRLAELSRPYLHGSAGRVIPFPHPYGCSQMGMDQENTRAILADLALHPNAGGVLVLGLGCENTGVRDIRARMGVFDEARVRFLVCQDSEDELEEGLFLLRALIDHAAKAKRERVSAGQLVVGLKCGGSDGFSGITANPVIGGFSDRLVARGGTALLTEVPEMFGAEHLLMARCVNEKVFADTVALINDFKQYYEDHRQPIYENPSPGNKAGGITTLEEKALGCTQKSGSAPVCGVLPYGGRVRGHGLHLLSAPGNDLVAATALVAAGAQIVLFSTGRGTPLGCPVPTLKISSNSALAQKKRGWIDFDAGRGVTGTPMDVLSDALFDQVLETAGGKPASHERAGMYDMAIFKQGVTL